MSLWQDAAADAMAVAEDIEAVENDLLPGGLLD
jgi:hypothetical protein